MRVISGRARGHKLKRVPGDTTRPITDRVKESLFNILGDWVVGTRWLDLFAGTGQVGIEALSRGAAGAVFLDTSRVAVTTIQDNLRQTRLAEGTEVLRQDAFVYLRRQPPRPFDVIYVAPPQYKGLWLEVLKLLDARPEAFLTEEAVVIVQLDPREYQELPLTKLALFDQRRYGNTMLCFYEVIE
ncbi:MAG: 16S rRNA (guanine(966)-N(2))-methyltransferase RsmD [Chloroflexi bacterium]|nr:16S rRNA (guanine(966)-N(2))-methyltransferase RsmD [Chloroflexota bacterium]MCI0579634.1 16S rRNA (guanine(966)-N(2))-methyltransferase RsmD [Chloroflexota bacterium]MCI0644392.1 16S rRNA (guanine(966)-N(2))-methyltransferase RsmD [Chloroflexota bacterium]MCI0727355.1 16S rRNA (guanine(966)-N(2))-methyltransferase RsmD [Chloroflexota bacterium]